MPVIPATREAEAGESLQSGMQRLQSAEIVPLHSSLGDSARLCLKQTNKKTVYLKGNFVTILGLSTEDCMSSNTARSRFFNNSVLIVSENKL